MAWSPNYCTDAELKSYRKIDDGLDDAQINLAIAAASRAIDEATRRQFGKVDAPAAMVLSARMEGTLYVVDLPDLASDVGVTVGLDLDYDGGFATPLTGFKLVNEHPLEGFPFSRLTSTKSIPLVPDAVRVTGTWGWATVPDPIKQATLMQASRFFARRDSPYGISGSPENGGELRLLARVDPDVAVILGRYRRRWWAV